MSSPTPQSSPTPTLSSPPPPPPADNTNTTTPPSPVNTTIPTSPVTLPFSPSLLLPPPPAGSASSEKPPSPPGPPKNTTLVALGLGIGIGGAIVLVCVGIFIIWYKRRKRRLVLAGTDPQGPKDDPGGPPSNWQHITPPPKDNMIGLLPKPTPPPGIAANYELSSVNSSAPPPPSMSSNLGSEKWVPQPSMGMGYDFSKSTFTYQELALATENFSHPNLLGQGGFGYVHKGVLPSGKVVAIKQLKVGSGQGEREFQAEVEIISRVHHRHLVSLVGYCSSGPQRMLVYEFVPNNTLEFHLHGKGQTPINWTTRMKVALGSAKGLAYLHEDCQPKIIHRDIKAANILLDDNFEPKVADFGLARFNSDTDTHVSTRVMGTFGYLAPEYALTGKLTDKSDVFSFGVMLLELITGRRPIDNGQYLDDNIVDWARPLLTQALEDGNFDPLADPRLQRDYDSTEMVRMVACAAVCVRHLARRRPRMSQIARALEGNMSLEDLNEGIKPGHSTIYDSHGGSSDYDTAQYKEDLKKFKKMALESQENNSSGYSEPTSGFGQQRSGSSSEGLGTTQDLGSSSEAQRLQISQKDGR